MQKSNKIFVLRAGVRLWKVRDWHMKFRSIGKPQTPSKITRFRRSQASLSTQVLESGSATESQGTRLYTNPVPLVFQNSLVSHNWALAGFIYGFLCMISIMIMYFIPETKGLPLDDVIKSSDQSEDHTTNEKTHGHVNQSETSPILN